MNYLSTITTKRQFTIPVKLFREAQLQEGQKVTVSYQKGGILIRPATDIIEKLSGSVALPKRFHSLTPEQIVKKAKREHFKKRHV